MTRRMTFREIQEGDRVRLIGNASRYERRDGAPVYAHDLRGYPAGAVGTVTMKCHDGLSRKPQVRVRFDQHQGEPFFTLPSCDLEYAP